MVLVVMVSQVFLKIALPFISGSLCDLFNLSLFSGKFPKDWKIARVAPIYKSRARDDCSNLRPLSVLPVLSRAFEKVVYNQLYDYVDSNRLIFKHQSGFRSLQSSRHQPYGWNKLRTTKFCKIQEHDCTVDMTQGI